MTNSERDLDQLAVQKRGKTWAMLVWQKTREIDGILSRTLGFLPEIDREKMRLLAERYLLVELEESQASSGLPPYLEAIVGLLSDWDQRLWHAYQRERERRPSRPPAEFR